MHPTRLMPAALAAAVLLTCGAPAPAEPPPAEALLEGVAAIAAPGVPGPLCVVRDAAFVVATGGSGRSLREPVVAATQIGKGRAVAFGHDGYFSRGDLAKADTGRLLVNAVRWVAATATAEGRPRVAVLREQGLLEFLKGRGIDAEAVDAGWHDALKRFDALCVNPVRLPSEADRAAVTRFVRAGGGLVVVGLGWGWKQLNPGRDLATDHPGNQLLAPAGIVWADGTLESTAPGGYATDEPPPAMTHAGLALRALGAQAAGIGRAEDKGLTQAVHTLTRAARSLPPDDRLLLPKLRDLQTKHAAATVPTAKRPVTMGQPLARLLLTLEIERLKGLPAEQITAHPAAAEFPGAVPAGAKRVTRTVRIDTSVPDWHSTGLYAAPGAVVRVTVPEAAVGAKLHLRIGAHADTLWHLDAWRRCPAVCRTFALDSADTGAASPFGGLVYLEVPRGCKLAAVPVTIRGAVEAPHYIHGETELAAWRKAIRLRPAPWAELATRKVVLTLPSKVVRNLDDPKDLMDFWDRIMDACAELAGRPLDRARPERYVADVQISAGYMHSGYPIMTLLDMPEVMVDKARLMRNDHGGIWGLFHETGHNHQERDWTFDGTGEVTVNLFTLYVFDKVIGMPSFKAHGAVSKETRARQLQRYFAAPDFREWKRDPFLALLMYMQMQEAFGWEPFRKVFAEYRGLPRRERPRTDPDRRDQWLVRFSRAVGRDLGPFFEAWRVPTSEAARNQTADLPAWMPDEIPAKAATKG